MRYWQEIDAFVHKRFAHIVGAVIALFVTAAIPYIFIVDGHDDGAEPQIIAEAIAAGQGFSYPAKEAWLCSQMCQDAAVEGTYTVSGWADPVYPYLMAGLISAFGETPMQKSMRILGVLAFAGTLFLVGLMGRRLGGPWAGVASVLFLLVVTRNYATAVNPASFSALLVAFAAYLLIEYGESLSLKQSTGIGGVLGLNVLTWSSGMIFIPAVGAYLLINGRFSKRAFANVAVIFVVAALLVTPWSVRNYLVFDELVPVRNGAGYLAWIGTVGATGTFAPERVGVTAPVPWRSNGPLDAVNTYSFETGDDLRQELEEWQKQILDEKVGAKSVSFNEAQRDKWYLKEALQFSIQNPGTAIVLGAVKLHTVVTIIDMPVAALWPLALVLSVATYFGVASAFLFIRESPKLMVPIMLTWAFFLPFAFISPFYYRYRQPVEPAIALLVGVSFVMGVAWFWNSKYGLALRARLNIPATS